MAIDNGETLPVRNLFKAPAQPLELILDQERHDIGEMHSLFFSVCKSRHAFSLHDRLALELGMMQYPRSVTDRRDRFACAVRSFDQLVRDRILGQIPHRPMTTRV